MAMGSRFEAIDKALSAVCHNKNPLKAMVSAIDVLVADDEFVLSDANLEVLFVRLLDARGSLDHACPERAPLFLYGARALKTLLLLRAVACEGAEFYAWMGFNGGLTDEEPAADLVKKCKTIDAVKSAMLDAALAELHFFKTGLLHELASREAIRKGDELEKVRAPYVVEAAEAERWRRDRIKMEASCDAEEAERAACYAELGASDARERASYEEAARARSKGALQ
ncbi:hypothetical protein [Methylocapsa palsarum]|uniref:Uncharacterized protein n=1 Tax=Methylocapsa palsarum TaxID=1612308 RepID=A0A1I4CEM6_9HYPH|nr:hypothetical protein [Methylocapsa palsarum]SFK79395.1 hypothetical protein SAMN05444581_12136 [Methylocapsa palsarum]